MIRHAISIIPGFILLTAALQPCLATDLEGGQEIEGTVSSVSDSEVVINTTSGGAKTYQVKPDALAALQLQSGNSVVLDTTRLETGVVKNISAYNIRIELDNGETRNFIFDREARRRIFIGDSVVITPKDFPSRCQKVFLKDDFELRAGDLRKVETFVAAAPVPQQVVRRTPPPIPSAPEFEPPPPVIPGLW